MTSYDRRTIGFIIIAAASMIGLFVSTQDNLPDNVRRMGRSFGSAVGIVALLYQIASLALDLYEISADRSVSQGLGVVQHVFTSLPFLGGLSMRGICCKNQPKELRAN